MKSIHDLLHGLDVGNSIEEVIEATEEAAGRLSGVDDRIREMVLKADDFYSNFEEKTVQELREYINDVAGEFQYLKDEIY
jgi:hypothetical protein